MSNILIFIFRYNIDSPLLLAIIFFCQPNQIQIWHMLQRFSTWYNCLIKSTMITVTGCVCKCDILCFNIKTQSSIIVNTIWMKVWMNQPFARTTSTLTKSFVYICITDDKNTFTNIMYYECVFMCVCITVCMSIYYNEKICTHTYQNNQKSDINKYTYNTFKYSIKFYFEKRTFS